MGVKPFLGSQCSQAPQRQQSSLYIRVCLCTYVHIHVEARGQHGVSSSVNFYFLNCIIYLWGVHTDCLWQSQGDLLKSVLPSSKYVLEIEFRSSDTVASVSMG